MRPKIISTGIALTAALLAGCGSSPETATPANQQPTGTAVAVNDTVITDMFTANGVAEPIQRATLSTKLMARVTAVLVHAGDKVTSGQLLLRLDSRDLEARRNQVAASVAAANAARTDAAAHARRIRGLYTDSAATRSQLDNAEAALARADAGVSMAQANAREVEATASYAEIRAPFAGIVTERLVDPGALAAPGAPLVTVADHRTLRISADATPSAVSALSSGTKLAATIGDSMAIARVEGVVPAGSNLYRINALVDNRDGRLLSGSSATLAIARGSRPAILIPAAAIIHQDDLTGVKLLVANGAELRWIRLGRQIDDAVEVLAGLNSGDSVLVGTGGN